MIKFYNQEHELIEEDPLRLAFDGKSGGPEVAKVYIRNDDDMLYFTYVRVLVETANYDDYGPVGTTGWGVKLMYGEREPTEEEWSQVLEDEELVLPDIGTTEEGDTFTYHPVWIRVFCPGNSRAEIRRNQSIKVIGFGNLVGM